MPDYARHEKNVDWMTTEPFRRYKRLCDEVLGEDRLYFRATAIGVVQVSLSPNAAGYVGFRTASNDSSYLLSPGCHLPGRDGLRRRWEEHLDTGRLGISEFKDTVGKRSEAVDQLQDYARFWRRDTTDLSSFFTAQLQAMGDLYDNPEAAAAEVAPEPAALFFGAPETDETVGSLKITSVPNNESRQTAR